MYKNNCAYQHTYVYKKIIYLRFILDGLPLRPPDLLVITALAWAFIA